MKLYFVRNRENGLYLEWDRIIKTWVINRELASLYRSQKIAQMVINCLSVDCEIVEIDTDAATLVLRDLFEVRDLGDMIYDIREREGHGWEGELVCKWGSAVQRARALVQEYDRDNAGDYDGP